MVGCRLIGAEAACVEKFAIDQILGITRLQQFIKIIAICAFALIGFGTGTVDVMSTRRIAAYKCVIWFIFACFIDVAMNANYERAYKKHVDFIIPLATRHLYYFYKIVFRYFSNRPDV